MTTELPPTGLVLLKHMAHSDVDAATMIAALPEAWRSLPRVIVDLHVGESTRTASVTERWREAQRDLQERVRERLDPVLEANPGYRILYYGSCPVPLTLALGMMLKTWRAIDVVPHHHGRRAWGWSRSDTPPARVLSLRVPTDRDRTPGEAIIRVSTSHKIDPQLTRHIVPLVEIDVELEQPGEDAFGELDEMLAVARAFREALDVLGDRYSGIHRIHLFAAVQPGMALLLGAQISDTMHPQIQTYQYMRNRSGERPHSPALLLNARQPAARMPLDDAALRRAREDRQALADDLEIIKGMSARERPDASWLASVLAPEAEHPAFGDPWLELPALCHTPIERTTIDIDCDEVDDSFRLTTDYHWQFDARWLAQLASRLVEADQRRRALRMLILHEVVHRGPQRLTTPMSPGMGRFPKVLEEMDYHADVVAMLYEYAFTRSQAPGKVIPEWRFFLNLVRLATNTMWAFDDVGVDLDELQVRRIHRYLIWYWQQLALERGPTPAREARLDDVLHILARRPNIEFAGPQIRTYENRIYYVLEERASSVPEVVSYHRGRLFRHGSHGGVSLAGLITGFRRRDPEQILGILRAVFDQTS